MPPTSEYNKIISTINSVSSNYSYTPDPNNLICIDSSNNRIGINTLNPGEAIDISGGNIRAKDFVFMDSSNNPVSLKELLNNKAPISNPSFSGIISANNIDISGNIVPLFNASSSLGSSSLYWSNAYMRDVSVSNIDVSGNLNPLISNSSNLGTTLKPWNKAYIHDISTTYIDVFGTLKSYKYDEGYIKLGETITNLGGNSNDEFGSTVAINDEGNIIAVTTGSTRPTNSRFVRIYKYNDISWVKISPDISGASAVSLNSTGTIAAICNREPLINNNTTGQVQVYRYVNDNSWVQISQNIVYTKGDNAISLNAGGNRLAIGSSSTNANGSYSGSTSVYKRITDGSWIPLGQTISGEAEYSSAGYSVSLDSTGSTLAIGAFYNNNALSLSGQVRVYRFTNDVSWVLISQDIDGTTAFGSFGYSVSLNSNGTLVACGATSGYVKVYKHISDGSWIPHGQTIIQEQEIDYAVLSVSLNNEGNILAIGGPYNDGTTSNSGHIRVYKSISVNNDISWIQISTDIDGEVSNGLLGYSVALNGLGNIFVAGAPSQSYGQAKVYKLTDLTQTSTSNILPLANNTYSLGSSTLSWSNAYIDKVFANNAINPNNTNTGTLGENGYRWNNGWINTIFGSALGTNGFKWTNAWVTNINGSTYTGTSDDRVKHNEVIINNGLDIIDQLTPKFYQKTIDILDASYNGDLSGYAWNYESGLIAQELLQISDLSFVVSGGDYYDSTNNLIKQTYGVNYNSVFVYGLAAIKELHAKVKAQETTILSLQTAILEQKTLINNIILAQSSNIS